VSTLLFSRRRLFAIIGGALVGLFLTPLRGAWARSRLGATAGKLVAVPLDTVPALARVGGFATVAVKGVELLLLRPSEKKIVALSPICTHEKCTVVYNPDSKAIDCPCHGSRFDGTGTPTKGPANSPLTRYPAGLKENQVIIKLP
jgi:cytochrome b6-f complex iron-sulfur subunit